MKIINIGVLAHVDAGKTTLTEQILYQTGVKERAGSVDQGDTTTDSLEIERRRGITVKSAAVSFDVDGLKVNLIDTPGHADFISEVEHALSVLDGVILVISAVEGVQAQTRVLMQTLKEQRIPTLLFMNKIDRRGANYGQVRTRIQNLLDPHICDMTVTENEGCENAGVLPADPVSAGWLETLALQDDELLRMYAEDIPVSADRLYEELIRQTKAGKAYPLFAGSAAKGIGVDRLLSCLGDFIPTNGSAVLSTAEDLPPLSGFVFKVIKDSSDEQAAYVRLFAGRLRLRDEVRVISRAGNIRSLKVKQLYALQAGKKTAAGCIEAGDIAVLPGSELHIGDVIGFRSDRIKDFAFHKPPIQVQVLAEKKEHSAMLHQALSRLTVEDPYLEYQHDQYANEHTIRVFGRVQQEVLAETIREQYGIQVTFSPPKVLCIEKPAGVGESAEMMGDPGNLFWATVGFKVEPGTSGSGITYSLAVELGALPLSFQKAIRETVEETLKEGLYGWPVTDIAVTLTHTGYASPVSTAKDFRRLAPLVLIDALSKAWTAVFEPVNAVHLVVPEAALSKVITRLAQLEGLFHEPELQGTAVRLNGTIPVRTADRLQTELSSLTNGEGLLSMKPGGYAEVRSAYPENERRRLNPLNRGEYLLRLNKIL